MVLHVPLLEECRLYYTFHIQLDMLGTPSHGAATNKQRLFIYHLAQYVIAFKTRHHRGRGHYTDVNSWPSSTSKKKPLRLWGREWTSGCHLAPVTQAQ